MWRRARYFSVTEAPRNIKNIFEWMVRDIGIQKSEDERRAPAWQTVALTATPKVHGVFC